MLGVKAAEQGCRLDLSRYFPEGSFPPAVIEAILKASGRFNPEAEFPQRSFPRPWPFVGGQLPPAPPPPPSRPLVLNKIGDKWTIVWRGEIPTVQVPRRPLVEIPEDVAIVLTNSNGAKEVQPASRDPARDPP